VAITSFTLALMLMVLALVMLENHIRHDPEIVVRHVPSRVDEPRPTSPRVTPRTQPKPSSPSSAMARVLAANIAAPAAIPIPDFEVVTPSQHLGDADDFGASWGRESGTGDGFTGIPDVFRQRCSRQDRMDRLAAHGGTPEVEHAVERGLEWLKRTQNSDGSWTNDPHRVGYSGLALLAYLGRCETPRSEKFGESSLRAISYLVDVGLRGDGKLTANPADSHWPYDHAIATYALAEALIMCRSFGIHVPGLEEVVLAAGRIIIDNQHPSGGWDYHYHKV
jgi:hypothetical protein